MPRRFARLLFRIIGWLLTPLVVITAAAIGATIGLIATPRISSANVSLWATVILALSAACIGLLLWARMLREHPGLRHTLDLTETGAPDSPLVQKLIHPEETPPTDPRS